LINMLYMLFD